jgi:CopG family transcriptional regulator/antitoxin EndoAI
VSKRINIMLPDRTLAVLDRVAPRGSRSRFVSDAVLHFVESNGKRNLSEQLKLGYQANADESLKIAAEWFPLEEEASQRREGAHRGRTSK